MFTTTTVASVRIETDASSRGRLEWDGHRDLVALEAGDGAGGDGLRSGAHPRHRQRRGLVRPRPGGPQSAPESRRTWIRRKGQIMALVLNL